MSIRVMSHTWDACPYEGVKLLVLLALCDFADDDGYCWPKMTQVAVKARCSEQYARQCIRDFEAEGWVATTEDRGRGHQNSYQIQNRNSDAVSKTATPGPQNRASSCGFVSNSKPSLKPSLEEDEKVQDIRPAAGVVKDAAHLSPQTIRRKMRESRAKDWEIQAVLGSREPTQAYYEWEKTRVLPNAKKDSKKPSALDRLEKKRNAVSDLK